MLDYMRSAMNESLAQGKLASHEYRCIRCGKRYGSAAALKDNVRKTCDCGAELEEVVEDDQG